MENKHLIKIIQSECNDKLNKQEQINYLKEKVNGNKNS